MPPFGFDPMGKGGPPPGPGGPPPGPMGCKGKGKGKPMGGPGFPPMGPMHREALDMQRFSVERKRRLREFAGSLHLAFKKEGSTLSDEQSKKTTEFQNTIGLQLEGHQLPVMASSEVVIADSLWLLWLHTAEGNKHCDDDEKLLMNLARLARVNQTRTRQLFIRAFREIWPSAKDAPSTDAIKLFSSLADLLPKVNPQPVDMNGMPLPILPGGARSNFPPGSPEYWRELVTQIYAQHNPSKLGDVDTLLTKYRGRERTLYLGICEKYKVPPTFGDGPAQPPAPGPPPGWPGAPP